MLASLIRAARGRVSLPALFLAAALSAGPQRACAQDAGAVRPLVPTAAQQPAAPLLATTADGDRSTPAAADPAALKAGAVLERHCARCHQDGKLKTMVPAAGLGNILQLDEIARVPGLVQPQNPDASRLYLNFVERRMPFDIYHEGVKGEEPTADEIQAVRDWIAGLKPRREACAGRSFISPEQTSETIRKAIDADPAAAKTTRFLTLTHLYNACVPDTELAGYRQAAAKLMNSLAWSLEPARLEPVDAEQTVLRLRLPDLGWVPAHWEKLARAYPYDGAPALQLAEDLTAGLGSRHGALPADWIASAAMRPELYADLLGLPAEFDDLKRILSLDTDDTVKRGKAMRAAVAQSQIARWHRMFETHPLPTGGMMWLAYEFAGTTGEQDIFQRPLGATGAAGVVNPFRHDAVRVMFNLPNGFLAYAVHDGEGRSLSHVPRALERAEVSGYGASATGSACVGCHVTGPIPLKDDLRRRLQGANTDAAKTLLGQLQNVLRSEGELQQLFEDETHRFRRALIRAGVDPDLRLNGLEPVTALRQSYERDVSLERAAAEYGATAAAFRAVLGRQTGSAGEIALRLQQGTLHRTEFTRLMAGLLGGPAGATAAAAAVARSTEAAGKDGGSAGAAGRVELVVIADRNAYKLGDLISFTARASSECRLTLISINRGGKAIVLFPNEFEQENLLAAGREIRVPGATAPYQLRVKEPGQETLVGVCTKTAKVADGIQPDYEKQRFTILGDWRNFIRSAIEEEAADRLNPERAEARNKKRRARGKQETAEPAKPGKPEAQTRTAIRYTVE